MGRALALTVQMLRGIEEAERRAVEVAHLNELMEERQRLLERLSKIQRSISTRAPLDQVLDAIVRGARELVGDGITGLRLLDSDDPTVAVLVASTGIEPEVLKRVRRGPAGHGVGGRAIVEDRLVVAEDYGQAPGALPEFAARHLQAAMAARCTRTAWSWEAWASPPTIPSGPTAGSSRRCCWPSPSTPAWP